MEHICDDCEDEVYGDLGHPIEFLDEALDMLVDGYFCFGPPNPPALLRWTDDLDKLIGSSGFRDAINRQTLKFLRKTAPDWECLDDEGNGQGSS